MRSEEESFASTGLGGLSQRIAARPSAEQRRTTSSKGAVRRVVLEQICGLVDGHVRVVDGDDAKLVVSEKLWAMLHRLPEHEAPHAPEAADAHVHAHRDAAHTGREDYEQG